MKSTRRYRKGQRWTFSPAVEGFEDTLVIGGVMDWNERAYDVYVRYDPAVRDVIPADYDGVILSLTAAGLDCSVTKLVKKDVKLPWWWVHGRRYKSKKDAPGSRGVLSCNKVSE